jgi:hypothetical protein
VDGILSIEFAGRLIDPLVLFRAGQLCRFSAKRHSAAGERLCPAGELQLLSA